MNHAASGEKDLKMLEVIKRSN